MKVYHVIIALALLISFQSCSPLLNPKRAIVEIRTQPDTKILFNEAVIYEDSVTDLIWIDQKQFIIPYEVSKEGFKTQHGVVCREITNKVKVYGAVALVTSVPLLIYGLPLGGVSAITGLISTPFGTWRLFPAVETEALLKYPSFYKLRNEAIFEGITMDTLNGQFEDHYFKKIKDWKEGVYATTNEKTEAFRDLSVPRTLNRMNDFIEEIGGIDTVSIRFGNYSHFGIHTNLIQGYNRIIKGPKTSKFRELVLNVEFEVINQVGDTVFSKSVEAKSGQFVVENSFSNGSPFEYIYYDALDYAVLELYNDPDFVDFLKRGTGGEFDNLSLFPQESDVEFIDSKSDFQKNAYYLKSYENQIICLPIGKDGRLAVSALGLERTDTLTVYDHLGTTFEATVQQRIPGIETAILKIDKQFERVFEIDRMAGLKHGQSKLYTVGFDEYYNAFLMNRGVLNATRKYHYNTFYQLDASCANQIYPAVLNERGELVGFVSKTLSSATVQGIAFSSVLWQF